MPTSSTDSHDGLGTADLAPVALVSQDDAVFEAAALRVLEGGLCICTVDEAVLWVMADPEAMARANRVRDLKGDPTEINAKRSNALHPARMKVLNGVLRAFASAHCNQPDCERVEAKGVKKDYETKYLKAGEASGVQLSLSAGMQGWRVERQPDWHARVADKKFPNAAAAELAAVKDKRMVIGVKVRTPWALL